MFDAGNEYNIETDFLRRTGSISRRGRITNDEIRRKVNVKDVVTDGIVKRTLEWLGHLLIMDDKSWQGKTFE